MQEFQKMGVTLFAVVITDSISVFPTVVTTGAWLATTLVVFLAIVGEFRRDWRRLRRTRR
jgi:hypothetical protein